MKIQKKFRPLPLILLITVVAASLGAASYFLYFRDGAPFHPLPDSKPLEINYDKPTDEQTKAGKDAKDATINNSGDTDTAPGNEEPSGSDSKSDGLSTSITVSEVNGSTLYIRNEIRGVYASGTCVLTLTNDSKTIRKRSGIQALAKVSTCQGFNIPTSELSPGTWNINLTVTIGDKKGTAQGSVNI